MSRLAFLIAITMCGCQSPPVPPQSKSPVMASFELPNAAGGGIGGKAYIHVTNGSEGTIKAVRDFSQAGASGQYQYVVRDANGREVKQKYPFTGGPPRQPTEKDYVVLEPGATGRLDFSTGVIAKGYALQPRTLYFIEVRIQFGGLAEPVTVVTPYGFAEEGKD